MLQLTEQWQSDIIMAGLTSRSPLDLSIPLCSPPPAPFVTSKGESEQIMAGGGATCLEAVCMVNKLVMKHRINGRQPCSFHMVTIWTILS